MTRLTLLLVTAAALAAAGCRSFEDHAGVFPRLRDRIDPDADHRQPYYRGGDQYAGGTAPAHSTAPAYTAAPSSGGCLPCGGGGYSTPINPYSGMTLGSPTVMSGGYGYALPTGYSSPSYSTVPTYSSGPILGSPVYPSGDGTPYRPRRDDELPPPGGYGTVGGTETGRSVAPKPPASLPTGK